MAANIMMLAVLAMFIGWAIYFHIQDQKEERERERRGKQNELTPYPSPKERKTELVESLVETYEKASS